LRKFEHTILRHLVDDNNDWEMNHFRERLKIYYDEYVLDSNNQKIPRHTIARRILDHIACEDAS